MKEANPRWGKLTESCRGGCTTIEYQKEFRRFPSKTKGTSRGWRKSEGTPGSSPKFSNLAEGVEEEPKRYIDAL